MLLLVVGTLRADHVGLGAAQSPTPRLGRLASRGLAFERARSTSAWTVPAHGSLFTGRHPSRHGAHWESPALPEEARTLAERLRASHATAGFSENPHIGRAKGFAQGFEVFEETWRRRPRWDRPPPTLARAERWLEAREGAEPFFLFVNLMTPHLPYAAPPRLVREHLPQGAPEKLAWRLRRLGERAARRVMSGARVLSAREWAVLRALYRADVAFADERAGALLELLEARGLLEETLVVVTSDHGENIGHHGLMEHQFCLYESLLRVPLVLHLPGVFEGGRRRSDPAQLVDVAPTVLGVLGRGAQPEMEGRDLREPVPRGRPVVAEYMRPRPQRALRELGYAE